MRAHAVIVAAAALLAGTAHAHDAPGAVTLSGSVGLVSDYRFRGVSQSDREVAVQGGATAMHRSGLYGGVWASNLSGWGTFGGANLELDLTGGVKRPLAGGTLDVGLTWYMYPGGADDTDFAEPFAKLSGTIGPATLLAGVAYAPPQQALGRWYRSGAEYATGLPSRPGDRHDNLYLWGDGAVALAGTPVTAKAHLGHSRGNRGLGPNGTSVSPTGRYWDWSLGADVAAGPVTFGIAYVDTDISRRGSAYLQPGFGDADNGRRIAGPRAVASVTAAF